MSKPKLTIALAIGENCEGEANAIRFALEYFGAKVTPFFIGRPSDFIGILSGEWLYKDMSHLILCFHGKAGKFVMQRLGKGVYESDEPRENFGPELIAKYAKSKNKFVLTTGCSLGKKEMAEAFLGAGCRGFIGAERDIDSNAALIFVLRFYYEILSNNLSEKAAFDIASELGKATRLFKFYGR